MRGWPWVWVAAIALSGCVTDVESGFGSDSVSAGGTGGVDTMPPASTAAPGSTSTGTGQGETEAPTTAADDTTSADPTSDTEATSEAPTGSGGDPCDPDPCEAPMACVDGACVGAAAPEAGDVVISELHPDPDAVADDNGEWLELWVVGENPVDLQGCELADEDTDSHEIASQPLIVEPDARIVLGKSESSAVNGGVSSVAYAYGGSFSLANGDDEVVLRCNGVVIDTLTYAGSWPFSAGVAAQLDPAANAANNDDVNTWCAAASAFGDGDLGTPGEPNDPC